MMVMIFMESKHTRQQGPQHGALHFLEKMHLTVLGCVTSSWTQRAVGCPSVDKDSQVHCTHKRDCHCLQLVCSVLCRVISLVSAQAVWCQCGAPSHLCSIAGDRLLVVTLPPADMSSLCAGKP